MKRASVPRVGDKPKEALLWVRDILVERADTSGRVAPRFPNLNYLSSEMTQDLPVQMSLLVGQLQNATTTRQTTLLRNRGTFKFDQHSKGCYLRSLKIILIIPSC